GVWVSLLRVPYRLLFPAIVLLCAIGVYSVDNSAFQVGLAALFGVVGYVLRKLEFEPAPLVLGFVLGPLMEENLRRALIVSRGDPAVFLREPLSAVFLAAALCAVLLIVAPRMRATRARLRED
ncbi:MAG: tripartite tricarboxylate transporter permease, partial [Alphaproteobacteria bacterium]|nr:tripartite tricarboxylate transporter permease [Alphaproteobacteria bacterium]